MRPTTRTEQLMDVGLAVLIGVGLAYLALKWVS